MNQAIATRKPTLLLAAILLFAVATASSQTFTDLYNFGTNSGDPLATSYIGAFTQGRDGNLYSTSERGGTFGKGTVFQLTPAGKMKVVYNFDGTSGNIPQGGLTLGTDGNLYGTTSFGGTNNIGVVFKLTTSGKFTVLHNFMNNGDGLGPHAAPTQVPTETFTVRFFKRSGLGPCTN